MFETTGRRYYQVQALRDITNDNFANGQIRFNFSVSQNHSFNPYLSYFRLRNEIKNIQNYDRTDGTTISEDGKKEKLIVADCLGPNMFYNDCLWQNIQININGNKITEVSSYYNQISALKHRMKNEEINKTLNKINFHDIYLEDRIATIAEDGYSDKFQTYGCVDFYKQFGLSNLALTNTNNIFPNLDMLITGVDSNVTSLELVGTYIKIAGPEISIYKVESLSALLDFRITWIKGFQIAPANNATINVPIAGLGQCWINNPLKLNLKDSNKGLNKFETIWKPCLGFFDINEWLPGGEYEIVLTPYPSRLYKIHALESKTKNVIQDVELNIIDMELNICLVQGKSNVNNIQFTEIQCQSKNINSNSLSQRQFIINPKSYALTLAFQDNRITNSMNYSSTKFLIVDDITVPGDANDQWLKQNLSRFYIQYDNEVLPNPVPDFRGDVVVGDDFISQQYWETQMNKIIINSDIETKREWIDRGMYFHYQWPRTNGNAKEVQISQEFRKPFPSTEIRPQLLLFYHFMCKFQFTTNQGLITDVKKTV